MAQNHDRPRYEDWKDNIALMLNLNNPSLGPGQVKAATAAGLDKMFHPGLERGRREFEEILTDPERNVKYVAMTYRDLLDEQNRLPLTKSDSLFNADSALNNPHLLAVAASEYQRGPSKKQLKEANPNQFGKIFLMYLVAADFSAIFGQDSRVTDSHRQKYMNYIIQRILK